MRTFFKKENLKKTILTFCYLVFGVLFCTLLSRMFNFAELVLCYLLLFTGIVCVIVYSLSPSDDKNFTTMIFGIFAIGLGLLIILLPRFFGVALSVIIGYSGVSLIISSLKQKNKGENNWIAEFVVGVVITVLAVISAVLSGTNTAKNILSIFVGVILLANGVWGLAELIALSKAEKQEKELLKETKLIESDKIEDTNKVENN